MGTVVAPRAGAGDLGVQVRHAQAVRHSRQWAAIPTSYYQTGHLDNSVLWGADLTPLPEKRKGRWRQPTRRPHANQASPHSVWHTTITLTELRPMAFLVAEPADPER